MLNYIEKQWFLLTPASPANDHWDACSRISFTVHGCSQIRSWVGGLATFTVVVVVTGCGGGGTTVVVSVKNAGGGGGGGGGGIETWTSIRKIWSEC